MDLFVDQKLPINSSSAFDEFEESRLYPHLFQRVLQQVLTKQNEITQRHALYFEQYLDSIAEHRCLTPFVL